MTRQQMIDVLVQDDIEYFVYTRMTDDLRDLFQEGRKGYNNYTLDELKEAIAEFDGTRIAELEKELIREQADRQKSLKILENTSPF